MATGDDCKIDPSVVAALYVEHAAELRNFLIGVLRDRELAGDVLQVAFARCVEVGHTARSESMKGWLFKVAFNEAMAVKRRQAVDGKATRKLAWTRTENTAAADERLTRWESVQSVRLAMSELPPEQLEVVRRRIYQEQTFAEIAAELNVPLGTVLTRMRLAMGKLKKKLQARKP